MNLKQTRDPEMVLVLNPKHLLWPAICMIWAFGFFGKMVNTIVSFCSELLNYYPVIDTETLSSGPPVPIAVADIIGFYLSLVRTNFFFHSREIAVEFIELMSLANIVL